MHLKLISEKISKFYINNFDESIGNGKEYFNKDKSLNFRKIYESLLNPIWKVENENIQEQYGTYDEYLCCYESLKPVFHDSLGIVSETHMESLNLKWLGKNSKCFIKSASMRTVETRNTENVLLLTAMLEYGLGSVYYTLADQRTPPHLLRDLLRTKELLDFFGHEAIMFLRVLLGTPNSINLRNIVWHGFPKPADIPVYYVTILLLIIHSFGNMLEEKQFVMKYRAQVQDFDQYITEIVQDLPAQTHVHLTDLNLTLEKCSLIDKEYKTYWNRILSLLEDQTYWNFTVLILPQIELILRIKYAEINSFDVSAKLDEYYITMDTIFETVVPHKTSTECDDKLISSKYGLNEGVLKLLYDLFIAPNGPRVRDKVGHGEVEMKAINNRRLCHVLLKLSFHLLCDDDIRFSLDNYESKFHLNCRTKRAINDSRLALNNLAQMDLSLRNSQQALLKGIAVKIFLRPKKESVYMLLILRIANLLTKTCQNYVKSITSCQNLLAQHELRSRRRRTLMSLLEALPKIHSCLQLISECLLKVFQNLQETAFENDIEPGDQLLRFLKRSLKISENFVKYSHEECNEWIKAIDLCSSFLALREKLFYADK